MHLSKIIEKPLNPLYLINSHPLRKTGIFKIFTISVTVILLLHVSWTRNNIMDSPIIREMLHSSFANRLSL